MDGGTTPGCTTPTAPSYTDDQVRANASLPELGKTVMDIMIAGLACDTMRVGSLLWSAGESDYNFSQILPNAPWDDLSCPPDVDTCSDGKNLPANFLHVMSHFPPSTANGVPGNMNTVQTAALECLTTVEVWFSEQLAYFAQQLAGIQEADGTSVLDNTVLLSAKDISEGVTHGYRDVPGVILGGQGLFKPGHFNLQNRKTSGDLFATIAQALGITERHDLRRPRLLHGTDHRHPRLSPAISPRSGSSPSSVPRRTRRQRRSKRSSLGSDGDSSSWASHGWTASRFRAEHTRLPRSPWATRSS
jgi:hypothetical protein